MTNQDSSIDIKELKQQVSTKKEERLAQIIQLGEIVQKQALTNNFQPQELQQLAQNVLATDKIIYKLSATILKESRSLENCPSCQQPNASNAKFCGNCGTLNPLFAEQQAEKSTCSTCEETIPSDCAFCPCCGVKQEAF